MGVQITTDVPFRKKADIGTIRAGRKADIIAVKGDVLKYINLPQNVDMVMKGGTLYKQHGAPIEKNLK